MFAEFLELVRGEGSAALVATHNERLAAQDGPRGAAARRPARIAGSAAGPFCAPARSPAMRNLTLTLIFRCLTTAACGPRKDKLDDSELAGNAGRRRQAGRHALHARARPTSEAPIVRPRGPDPRIERRQLRQDRWLRPDRAQRLGAARARWRRTSRSTAAAMPRCGYRPASRSRRPHRAGRRHWLYRRARRARDGHAGPVRLDLHPACDPDPGPHRAPRAGARAVAPHRPIRSPRAPQRRRRPASRPAAAPRPTVATSAPSFNCRRARTSGERAVCAGRRSPRSTATMAAQYRRAVANGGPASAPCWSRPRPLPWLPRPLPVDDACIDRAYRGRMREIDDIVAGRWRGDALITGDKLIGAAGEFAALCA